MSNAQHIAGLDGDHGISLSSSVQNQLTEGIMKDICIDKNWIEGGTLDGFRGHLPTTHINKYEADGIVIIETRVDSRHLGGGQVITYEVVK